MRDKASYVLEQGDIRFVVSGALAADSPIADHVRKHGDGVHDLAWLVDDATAALRRPPSAAAPEPSATPWTETDDDGDAELAQVATYGETVHTFVNRRRYRGRLLEPGYATERPAARARRPRGRADRASTTWSATSSRASSTTGSRFYSEVLGFRQMRALRRRARSPPSTRR